jgi:hypothetical protein
MQAVSMVFDEILSNGTCDITLEALTDRTLTLRPQG